MFSLISLGLALLPYVTAVIHDVQVGPGGQLVFSPEAISAQPGDQVTFHFNPKNHTVTQSSFADPCGFKPDGIDSGFMPVAANQTGALPTFTISVPDTNPIWIHCAQTAPASHCGQGMVFAVNCGADGSPNSFTNFKNAALAVGASLAAAASSSSAAAAPTASPEWTTAAYGGYSIPVAPSAALATQAVTLGSEVWTTTYSSYPGSPAPTPVAPEGAVHTVIVGGSGQLTFAPAIISAQPKDVVMFVFQTKNHTVTQSSFDDPCRKINATGVTGFDSGFMPVTPNTTTGFPTFNYTVLDTNPVWGYCRQQVPSSHCGQGMVFAINSVESSARNFAAFQNVAKALNGTSAASTAPNGTTTTTTTTTNGATSVRMGGVVLTVVIAIVAVLL